LPSPRDNRQAAVAAFEDAGREITQAFGVLSSNVTLAAGTLAALLAVVGAGELFNRQTVQITTHTNEVLSVQGQSTAGIPELSNVSLILFAAALPLLVRFFLRATLGYQQLLRFNRVRDACWRYLAGEGTWESARAYVRIYVTSWRSPETLPKLAWGSAKYGFVWLFVVYLLVLLWGFLTADNLGPRLVAAGFIVIGVGFEAATLTRHYAFDMPSKKEQAELKR
jgi:hypothetical protein